MKIDKLFVLDVVADYFPDWHLVSEYDDGFIYKHNEKPICADIEVIEDNLFILFYPSAGNSGSSREYPVLCYWGSEDQMQVIDDFYHDSTSDEMLLSVLNDISKITRVTQKNYLGRYLH